MTTQDTSGAFWPDGTKRSQQSAFTSYGATPIDIKKLDNDARQSRRQTAVVVKHAAEGKQLSTIYNLSHKSTLRFPPVVGREASQPDIDRRRRNARASI